ncbi:MAG: YfdX family protein [Epsilonproteobacteria bacterium]|nr:YfdX family protein [Campylobacterota bacterium]
MKKLALSTLLASLLLSTSLYANTAIKSVKEVNKAAVNKGSQDALASQKKLIMEAVNSLEFTNKALVALSKNDKSAAQKNIEKALGKLEVILAAKDAPKFLPIDSQVTMVEFVGGKEDVKKAVDTVEDLLDHKKVQVARQLLNTLQSEIDVTVVSLPLATYPDALRFAAKYIHENKIDKAKDILQIALSTFDKTTTVIPLPLLKATDLINVSASLSKNGKKEEALKYLAATEEQLDVAEALGYVSHSSNTYKSLHKVIKHARKEIKGKNKAEKLFDEIKGKLKDFKTKVFSEKTK